jgi:hypothetical protein
LALTAALSLSIALQSLAQPQACARPLLSALQRMLPERLPSLLLRHGGRRVQSLTALPRKPPVPPRICPPVAAPW